MTLVLAVTGGTGFVGGHLLRLAAEAQHELRALTRKPQLPEPGITWIEGALDRPDSLSALCQSTDAVIHIAGLISGDKAAFHRVNVEGTRVLIDAARQAGARRFIHVSSLAAREPDLSAYGASKSESEQLVRDSGLDWTIVRPPAVFGPGDQETLELFRMAKRGLVALPPKGRFSVIHVEDLCRLLLALPERPDTVGQLYEPDDGREGGWAHRHFARTLGRLFGKRAATFAMPRLVMAGAARIDSLVRRDRAKLTPDRARYFSHKDWVVRAECRPPAEVWQPSVRTATGLKQTAEWYQREGWL
jgi:nucleoside-diphosphate-sugar epimerase